MGSNGSESRIEGGPNAGKYNSDEQEVERGSRVDGRCCSREEWASAMSVLGERPRVTGRKSREVSR